MHIIMFTNSLYFNGKIKDFRRFITNLSPKQEKLKRYLEAKGNINEQNSANKIN